MTDLALILKAASFAAERHRNQRRKDAEASPYINHPLALASVLANGAGITDTATICAALLHDTIEDTQTSADEIEHEFGWEIRSLVEEVTDDKNLPKAERKRLQVEHAMRASSKAKLVKLADKICNLRDIANAAPAKFLVLAYAAEDGRARFFVINSELTEFQKTRPEIMEQLVPLTPAVDTFLTHESWLNCSELIGGWNLAEVEKEVMADPSKSKGALQIQTP